MKKIFYLSIVVSVLFSCSSSSSTVKSSNNSSVSENSELSAVLWQQTAAEYEALCYQAFNIATLRVKGLESEEGVDRSKELTIVMDLDETVLDNSPFNGWMIQKNQKYSSDNWAEWTHKKSAKFVPGALDFIRVANELGYKIIYISNRSVDALEETIENLDRSGLSFDGENIMLKTSSSSKIDRRAEVLANHNIFMLIGDNLSDFNNKFEQNLGVQARKKLTEKFKSEFGSKFIILPNVMYGDWEKTLRQNNQDYIQNPNASGLRRFIKGF